MKCLQNLDEEKIQDAIARLSQIGEAMHGLVTLLTSLRNLDFDGHDLRGIGRLIHGQILELSSVEQILKFGAEQNAE